MAIINEHNQQIMMIRRTRRSAVQERNGQQIASYLNMKFVDQLISEKIERNG